MSSLSLTKICLHNGVWEGLIERAPEDRPPGIRVVHHGRPIDDVSLSAGKAAGQWHLAIRIPPAALTSGIQTFLILDAEDNAPLGDFVIIADPPEGESLKAEVALLRAELDLLKRSFRRHCTGSPG
ncbi:hypothetical protein [Pontibaca methylaminivorans]|uniref:hypothetical protein n=1 Tax=Pontibaca methylaminivorans TaxID=515897 RepID=UPI002FDB1318